MRGCDVVASTNKRHLYIQATGKSVEWIQSGLRSSVKAYLDKELGAMSHTSSSATANQVPTMRHLRAGVRDKIHWKPELCQWNLKYKGELGADEAYCKEHNLNLGIPKHLCNDEFLHAREQAFLDALQVWNAIDKSGRKRISIPDRRLDVQMVPVPYSEVSHTDSEQEAEQDDSEG